MAALVGLVVWGTKQAKNAIAGFSFEIAGYGRPTLKNYMLTIPLQVRFDNPTPFPINIDNLIADVYVLKNDQYVRSARVSQAVSLAPGISEQTIYPTLDLASLFGGNVLNTLTALRSVIEQKVLKIKADVTATYGNITLPTQTFIQDVAL